MLKANKHTQIKGITQGSGSRSGSSLKMNNF